MAGTVSEH